MSVNDRIPALLQRTEGRHLNVIGHEIRVKLTDAETAGDAFVFEDVCPPAIGVPPHVHQREDEILIVLEGEYEVFLDGRRFVATKGAVANFPRFVPHGFRNTGQEPARALFVVTPGHSFAKFFDELSSLPSNVPPDPAKVAEIFGRYGMEILAPQPA
jgi:mannose-6-phosphate isomerase-like protein (cupin superfamily)